mgnify:FL=1
MFYVWHTLLVASFIAIAYYLGFEYGKKSKAIKKSKAKLWKALKRPTVVQGDTDPVMPVPNLETSHKDWLKGYRRWKKQSNQNN